MLLCCGLIPIALNAQIYNTKVAGQISLVDKGQYYELQGTAINKTPLVYSLRYVLSVINNEPDTGYKKDAKERFILPPNGQKEFKGPIVPKGGTEKLILLLLVYDSEDTLLGMDRVVLNGDGSEDVEKIVIRKEALLSQTGDGGFTLRGLISDETKTKFGRDFFRIFEDRYRNGTYKGTKIVTIKETFALANTTKIQVLIGNEKFLEFVLPPKNDVIEEYAKQSYIEVIKYFQRSENNISNILNNN